jgi:hypothetical protein
VLRNRHKNKPFQFHNDAKDDDDDDDDDDVVELSIILYYIESINYSNSILKFLHLYYVHSP